MWSLIIFHFSSFQSEDEDGNNHHKLSIYQSQGGDPSKSTSGSVQWMSSKMRLMQKMMSPNCQATDKPSRTMKNFQNNQQHGDGEINSPNSSNNNTIRVCADCNTTTTPLWRSGPRGPKVIYFSLLLFTYKFVVLRIKH